MKLEVNQKIVGTVPQNLLDSILDIIEEDDWHVSDYRKGVGNMSDTNTIPIFHTPLCASGLYTNEPIRSIRKEKLYDKFFPKLEPIFDILKQIYTYRQFSVFIARLRPGGKIGFHRDSGNFLELCHRVHVPLQSNPNVEYIIDDKSYYWEPGNIYEFDNTKIHGVFNNSNEYRIHIVTNLYNLTDEQLAQ